MSWHCDLDHCHECGAKIAMPPLALRFNNGIDGKDADCPRNIELDARQARHCVAGFDPADPRFNDEDGPQGDLIIELCMGEKK